MKTVLSLVAAAAWWKIHTLDADNDDVAQPEDEEHWAAKEGFSHRSKRETGA